MTPKSILNIAIKAFLTVAVPVLLAVFSIRLVMSYQFLEFEYLRPDFPRDSYGFTTADRLEYAPYAIDYLLNGEGIDYLGDLRLPIEKCWQPSPDVDDCPMYEAEALRHMVDVKIVTETTYQLAFAVFLIVLAIFFIGYRYKPYRFAIRRGLTYGSMLTLSLIVMIVVLALTAWDFFFDTFHEIFFEAGTWRFAFSDTLIRLFPEQFWFDASITIGVFTTIGAVVILAVMWQWSRHTS